MPVPRATMHGKEGDVASRGDKRSSSTAYQLRVTLLDTRPPVWRRILVPPEASAEYLHEAIQASMGWYDCHLHHFLLGKAPDEISVEPPDPENDGGFPTMDSTHLTIRELLRRGLGNARYEYDFGDSWRHSVRFEKEVPLEPGMTLPQCVDGKRACPPEDCGGAYGYAEIVRMVKEPKYEPDGSSREEMLEWLGGSFDPEEFDIARVNKLFAARQRDTSKPRHR
jgi:hypothetical protein